jgi:hypothetical protein
MWVPKTLHIRALSRPGDSRTDQKRPGSMSLDVALPMTDRIVKMLKQVRPRKEAACTDRPVMEV